MNTSILTDLLRQAWAGLRLLLALTVLLGLLYPGAVWAVGRTFGDRADGQPVRVDGTVVGSRLLGQEFTSPQWFHGRPSAQGNDPMSSGPSNLGPSNPALLEAIAARRAAVAGQEQVPPERVPADALTASGSGLDPHISPEYAALQVARVARVNGLSPAQVTELVHEHTQGRVLGFLGEPVVNVLDLNLAVRAAARTAGAPSEPAGDKGH